MKEKEIKDLLEILLTLQYSKELPRQGLIQYGYKRSEADSIASHSHSTTVMSFLIAKKLQKHHDINMEKVISLALFHDLGEVITGDFGFFSKMLGENAFNEIENKAFKSFFKNLEFSDYLYELKKEYDKQKTMESQIVKVADTLDAIALAVLTPSADLSGFLRMREIKHSKLLSKNTYLADFLFSSSNLLFSKQVSPYRRFEEKE